MRLRRPHAVVVAVVLATGAGCGGDPSVSRPASSPAELLQGAGEAAREHGTLTFSFEYVRTRADRPDDPERYGSGEGALDLSERRGRLRLELELGLQSDAARELEQPFELRWDEEWVEAELQGKSRKIARERARETGGLVGRLPDEPEAMLAFLELGSEARLRSEETLGGEPMSVVEFVVAARKAGELGAPAELAGATSSGLLGEELELEAWIGEDGLARRIVLSVDLEPVSRSGKQILPARMVRVRYDLDAFGTPVTGLDFESQAG